MTRKRGNVKKIRWFLFFCWLLFESKRCKRWGDEIVLPMKEMVPKLRKDIEVIPTVHDGQQAFLFRDSLGLIEEPFLLFGDVLHFVGLIDGQRNIRDIQLDLIRMRKGVFISSEEVEQVIAELDSLFLLDSERYRQQRKRIVSSYALLKKREAFHAGRSYPKNQEELRDFLDSFFSGTADHFSDLVGKRISGLVAPHIDLKIGKRIYVKAYRTIQNCPPERVLLLGTGHNLGDSLFSLTEKDFETPLGLVRTDKDWVRELRLAGDKIVASDDLAHRSEHSIEFQLLFLQYLFGTEFLSVPILCGSFQKHLHQASRPQEIPGMNRFLEVLRAWPAEAETSLIIAGVDFSHIGLKFGHRQSASALLMEAKKHDQFLLDALCRGNIKEFWSESRQADDKYNVCGFSCLACLMEILPGCQGNVLDYDFWEEEATQSAVSYAAVIMARKE